MERPAQPEKSRPTEHIRTSSFNNPSQAKKDLPILLKKGLPPCPRAKPVAGYSDWYSLKSTSSLDFCPECISHMDRTVYRLNFRPSPPRSSEKETFCALGGDPWVRLAWQLTLARQRPDIKLLEGIAAVQDAGDCPGESSLHHHHRSAATYGVKDRDGYYIPHFSVCRADVDKLELLMPTLYGLFVPLPNRTSTSTTQPRKCALRTTSTRFTPYITHLSKLHDTTRRQQQSTPTDPTPFTDFVQRKARLQECPKDAQFGPNVLWHHHPHLKEFTICEDCFDSVVEPELARGKSLLVKGFPRAKGVVYSTSAAEEKGGVVVGRSCQLYGAYMRGIFAKAVEEENFELLAKWARKRREAEVGLQEGYRRLGERLRRLEGVGGEEAGEERRRLQRKLREIREDWATWE
ncbi:hypothetical protein BDY17DRAFT_257996 [Neohortaea acidophila]|uniref:Uncharacterized protein n=1 Tax=Neohortaea acidophila TaxID=245834 RepID=A0A6A6PH93_9PEZI|nr:uncharacterized protein BDY17DRAFT_257996 [Neohortaea acidophila]KAF2479146.1 hypothetical protein BDY17DRAFT_257996 [Neohortaea acidophila]